MAWTLGCMMDSTSKGKELINVIKLKHTKFYKGKMKWDNGFYLPPWPPSVIQYGLVVR